MKKFTFNFSFLDRFKKSKNQEHLESEEIVDEMQYAYKEKSHSEETHNSEYDSEISPEEFAEKTLTGFNINELQDELHSDEIDFEEIAIPKTPAKAPKFKFKFPKFSGNEARKKIKDSFAGGSPMDRFDKFTWNDFVLRLFSPYTRGKVHAVFILFLVVVVTYMLGKNIALFINKAPPIVKTSRPTISVPMERADTTLQDINKITATNLFNAKENDKSANNVVKKDIDSIVCDDAESPTSLQIKLLDTIVLQDSVKSVASVQVRGSSELLNVREGEHLEEMAEVSKINRMKLILKNLQTGNCEYAATEAEPEAVMPKLNIMSAKAGKSLFKSSNPNIKNTGNNFKIKKSFRDSLVSNMSDVLTQAKAVQITNPDGALCFKMTEVVAGSLYSQLDIQENDIICNINGKKIDNLNELMGLLGRIKEIDQFQIGLKRNGMSENKEYGFE